MHFLVVVFVCLTPITQLALVLVLKQHYLVYIGVEYKDKEMDNSFV